MSNDHDYESRVESDLEEAREDTMEQGSTSTSASGRSSASSSEKPSQVQDDLQIIGKGPFFSENLMGLKKICQITILNLNFEITFQTTVLLSN